MAILWRKLVRDLWQSKGQFISVLIVVVIGVMFYSGINSTFMNLTDASNKYYTEYRLGDIWLSFTKAPEDIERKVKTLPFVKMATGRIVQDVNTSISGDNAVLRLITLPDEKKDIVNDIFIKSGKYFDNSQDNQCLLEDSFFKANNLKTGNYIYPIINGNMVKLKVKGSVINPEYVYAVKDSSELVADSKKFGVVYIKKSFGKSVLGFNSSINNLSITVKDGTDIEAAKDDLEKFLKGFAVTGINDRDAQLSYKTVSEKMKGFQSFGAGFPVIFFIVAAVIIYITMGRMVENQRTQIGVLKAFGFNNLQILIHYLSYSAFIAILGSIIGAVFGVFLAKGFTQLINAYFNFPNTNAHMYPGLVIPASLLTLFFCLLAGYNSCKKVFRIMPSEAMRSKAPSTGRKILIERINIVWKSLSFSWKIILRNIARYKKRALLTSTGIIFATVIMVFALGEKSSVDYLINQQYSNIQNYDIKISFSKFLSLDELNYIKSIPHVVKIEPLVETGVEISNGWRKKDVSFTALVNSPGMYKVTDTNGSPVEIPSKGILIPQKLASALGAKPGDTVYLKSFLPGRDKKEIPVKGIITQYLGTSAYGDLDSAAFLLGSGKVANSAVIDIDDPKSEKEVLNDLKKITSIRSVQSKSDSQNNLIANMSAITSELGVMILLASVLSIAVVYNISAINIFERQRELATLKVLGFKDNEVKRLIFNENYIITAFGTLLGLPAGQWLGSSMMASYQTDAYTIPFITSTNTFIIAALLTLLFTYIANLTLRNKIKDISMVEVLKSNE